MWSSLPHKAQTVKYWPFKAGMVCLGKIKMGHLKGFIFRSWIQRYDVSYLLLGNKSLLLRIKTLRIHLDLGQLCEYSPGSKIRNRSERERPSIYIFESEKHLARHDKQFHWKVVLHQCFHWNGQPMVNNPQARKIEPFWLSTIKLTTEKIRLNLQLIWIITAFRSHTKKVKNKIIWTQVCYSERKM